MCKIIGDYNTHTYKNKTCLSEKCPAPYTAASILMRHAHKKKRVYQIEPL